MASITIKDIPPELHQQLKERAERHRRSLNAEVIACLESVLAAEQIDPERELQEIKMLRERVGGYLTQDDLDFMIEEGRN